MTTDGCCGLSQWRRIPGFIREQAVCGYARSPIILKPFNTSESPGWFQCSSVKTNDVGLAGILVQRA